MLPLSVAARPKRKTDHDDAAAASSLQAGFIVSQAPCKIATWSCRLGWPSSHETGLESVATVSSEQLVFVFLESRSSKLES